MKLIVVGDTVLARPPREPTDPEFVSALSLLDEGDLSLANLEAPLVDVDHPAEKEMTIRVATATAADLAAAGVQVVSLATNHALDHGVDGLRSTMAALDRVGIRHAGGGESLDEADAGVVVVAADGTRVAVLSFCSTLPLGYNATTHRAGIAPIHVEQSLAIDGALLEEQPGTPPVLRTAAREVDVERVEQRIEVARSTADRVVVCMHWGVAFAYLPSNQGPLAEYQQPLGRRLVDAGADVVVGTHPHCLHPVERWGDGLILYSTGNFLFHVAEILKPDSYQPLPYQSSRLFGTSPWVDSAVFEIDLRPGRAPGLRIKPIVLDEHGEPVIADARAASRIRSTLESATREIHPDAYVDVDGFVHLEPPPGTTG